MARCLVIDVENDNVYEKECDKLQDFYDALGCDCFDIANRRIEDKRFDIFCDDVGLFREKPIVSALDKKMNPMLVGNLIFANHNMSGETTSLSDDDIEVIKRNIISAIDYDEGRTRSVVYNMEY